MPSACPRSRASRIKLKLSMSPGIIREYLYVLGTVYCHAGGDPGRFDDGRGCLRIRDGGLRSPGVHTRLLTMRIPNRDAEYDHVDNLVIHAINVGAWLRPARLWLQDAAPRCDWPASQSPGKVGFGGCLQRFSLRSITWKDTNELLGNLEHCQPPLMACVFQSRAVRGGARGNWRRTARRHSWDSPAG